MLLGLCLQDVRAASGALSGVVNYKAPDQQVRFAPGEVLVKFKAASPQPSIGPAQEAALLAAIPAEAHAALQQIKATVKRVHPLIGVLNVQVPKNASVGQAIETLYRSGTVQYAEPNYEVKAIAPPNDPKFIDQWALNNTGQAGGTTDADMDALEGWSIAKYGDQVITCVIDTGVDYNHEDLVGNMWINPGEVPGNGTDDDGNGYTDDVYGIDRYNYDSDPMDDHGHGTHCAGIIGAKGNNGVGICGVAWSAKIMALKFLGEGGSGYTSDAVTCMEYALAEKTANGYTRMVWSNSWGGGAYSETFYDTINAARLAGVLFVAAAGNDGLDADVAPMYPGGYDLPNIISVGSSDRFDHMASNSNFGSFAVDLFAPGVEIWSTLPAAIYPEKYGSWSGTSMACPEVSGACAVVWTKRPTLNWKKIKALILNGTEDGKAAPAFATKCVTEGRLNLQRSLASTRVDDPAIFSVTPNKGFTGATITIVGINFGATQGTSTLKFQNVAFGETSIVSWTGEKIVAKVPAGLPRGMGRLVVTTSLGTSRGAGFGNVSTEAYVGKTIIPRAWGPHAQVGTNNVWLFGGSTIWGLTGLVEKYTLSTNRAVVDSAWMMPTPVCNAGAAAAGTKVYVVGGYNPDTDTFYDTLQIFDTTTGTWTAGANLPKKIMQPAVVSDGTEVYVFGGMDESFTVLTDTYKYTPATNSWTSRAPLNTATAYATAVSNGAGKFWVMGGFSTMYLGSEQNVVQEYDPVGNAWANKPSMNKARAGAGGTNNGTKLFCLHGTGEGTYGLTDGEWYDGSSWTNDIYGALMLYTPATGRYTNKIYSLTGYVDFTDYSNSVWRFISP